MMRQSVNSKPKYFLRLASNFRINYLAIISSFRINYLAIISGVPTFTVPSSVWFQVTTDNCQPRLQIKHRKVGIKWVINQFYQHITNLSHA